MAFVQSERQSDGHAPPSSSAARLSWAELQEGHEPPSYSAALSSRAELQIGNTMQCPKCLGSRKTGLIGGKEGFGLLKKECSTCKGAGVVRTAQSTLAAPALQSPQVGAFPHQVAKSTLAAPLPPLSQDAASLQQAAQSTPAAPAPPSPQAASSPHQVKHVGPLSAEDLTNYIPGSNRSHLRLGITTEGMLRFLEKVGFIRSTGRSWLYSNSYVRAPELSWVNTVVGVPEEAGEYDGGRKHITGYDICDFIRKWLRSTHHELHSACEVILMDPKFADIRSHVGIANVFWSHLQMEGFVGDRTYVNGESVGYSTMRNMKGIGRWSDELPFEDEQFLWLDYLCLRQCLPDFHPDAIVELVRDIGVVAAAIDERWEYVKRTFCVLELYAAVDGECKLALAGVVGTVYMVKDVLKPLEPGEQKTLFRQGPIDAREAQALYADDKRLIDRYIEAMPGGFEHLNESVTLAMMHAAEVSDRNVG